MVYVVLNFFMINRLVLISEMCQKSSSDILKSFSCPTNSTAFFFLKFHIDRAFLLVVLLVFHTKKNDASLNHFHHNSYVRVVLLAPSCFPLVVVMMFTHN